MLGWMALQIVTDLVALTLTELLRTFNAIANRALPDIARPHNFLDAK